MIENADSLYWGAAHVHLDPHPGHAAKLTTRQHGIVSAIERHVTGIDGGDLWCLTVKKKQRLIEFNSFVSAERARTDVQTHREVQPRLHHLANTVLQQKVRGRHVKTSLHV